MRGSHLLGLACGLTILLGAASFGRGAEKPALELTDEGLPLQEIRPLDRHVHVLTLEGKWNRPRKDDDMKHYVNVLFANGHSASHRVLSESLFRQGEIRCVLQEYELIKGGVAEGGDFQIVISERHPVDSATDKEVISDALKVTWPLDRLIVARPPHTRHTPPDPVDAFPFPDDPLLKYPPPPKKP